MKRQDTRGRRFKYIPYLTLTTYLPTYLPIPTQPPTIPTDKRLFFPFQTRTTRRGLIEIFTFARLLGEQIVGRAKLTWPF
jgi:hypothetical protein